MRVTLLYLWLWISSSIPHYTGLNYKFDLDDSYIIDSMYMGNEMRYLNHEGPTMREATNKSRGTANCRGKGESTGSDVYCSALLTSNVYVYIRPSIQSSTSTTAIAFFLLQVGCFFRCNQARREPWLISFKIVVLNRDLNYLSTMAKLIGRNRTSGPGRRKRFTGVECWSCTLWSERKLSLHCSPITTYSKFHHLLFELIFNYICHACFTCPFFVNF